MRWKNLGAEYFTFTRKERIGLIVVAVAIIGIWIFPKVSAPRKSKFVSADSGWIDAARKLQHTSENDPGSQNQSIEELVYDKSMQEHVSEPKGELFYFDPNSLPFEKWKKLGIPEKTITTIQKYITKGGHFYKPEDLKKIYGIHPDAYQRLEPYIRIETTKNNSIQSYTKSESRKDHVSNNNSKYPVVEINVADTSAFIELPGIGSTLAARIVNFRDKLGGFYSTDQIRELYGLPDSTFQKIKSLLRIENSTVRKININKATKEEMKSHPYLKWNLANAIVEYRNQHGNFSTLEDLKKVSLVTDEIFDKIRFYITL